MLKRARAEWLVFAALLVAATGVMGGVGLADTSPGGHDAAPWPSSWAPYTTSDGTIVLDPAGDAFPPFTDLVTGPAGDEATLQTAFDGTNLFFRLRLGGDPVRTAIDYRSAHWLVGLGVNGIFQGAVGFDGKPPGALTEYVYIVDATGTAVTPIYEDPFTAGPTNDSRGVRGSEQDSVGNWFLDFQVPIDAVYAGTGVQSGDQVQLFAGTSTSANVAAVNKDWMIGVDVDFTDLEVVELTDATIELAAGVTPVSGPEPPVVGATSTYDLIITARNSGLNTLGSLSITDSVAAGAIILGVSETSGGSISHDGTTVTWLPSDLASGAEAQATVTVEVRPLPADLGLFVPIDAGASGTGVDNVTGFVSTASLAPIEVGPVQAVTGVSLAKAFGDQQPITAGSGGSHTIVVSAVNGGVSNLTAVTIEDTLDAGLTPLTNNCSDLGGTDSSTGNSVRCEALTLDAGSSFDFVVSFEVPPSTDSVIVENQAMLSAAELGEPLLSNVATVDVIEEVNLSLVKQFVPASLPAGSTAGSVSVVVTNGGPSDADQVRVLDTVDPHLVVTGATIGGGVCADTDGDTATVECEIDTLAAGASAEMIVLFELAVQAVPGTTVSNVAEVISAELGSPVVSGEAVLTVADRPPLPPDANTDAASTEAGTAVTVAVLGNDGDPQGDALEVVEVTQPGAGTASINDAGTVTYVPDAGFVGQDAFVYEVCERDRAAPLCDASLVVITVTEVDRPPALDAGASTIDRIAVGETPQDLPVSDPEGAPIAVKVVSGPVPPGTLLLVDGRFTGLASQAGAFVFTFEACDPAGQCSVFVYAVVVEP